LHELRVLSACLSFSASSNDIIYWPVVLWEEGVHPSCSSFSATIATAASCIAEWHD